MAEIECQITLGKTGRSVVVDVISREKVFVTENPFFLALVRTLCYIFNISICLERNAYRWIVQTGTGSTFQTSC